MKDFDMAKNLIVENKYACVIVKEGKVIYASDARGIFPLYEAKEILKIDLNGAALADKVIGKAAAMIAVEGGVEAIHGQVMSVNAINYLIQHEITYSFDLLTEYIKNRELTGMCPVETRAITTDDYSELNGKVKEFLKTIGAI
ncbi:MAG: DUF1893 domain-containing protein [Clostridiales bacterium]|nr:DUF1893 domain-containing protein [Clostridiales bacterium]